MTDIRKAVTFARERQLLLAVKCGGHSYAGKSTCDGGMQIDLSTLRHARVDVGKRVAHVAGGSLLGELDRESMAVGLVTTAGTVRDPVVEFSTSSLFDRAATRAVLKFKYKPRVVDGQPVEVPGVKTRIRFELED